MGGLEVVGVGTALALAWAGVRHRPASWLLLALGVALAAVMPLAASGLQERAAVGAVRQAVAAVAGPSRGVLAVTSRDLRGAELTALSEQVGQGFGDAGLPAPTRALAFRALSLQGTDATVAALDGLADDVILTAGRLPQRCTTDACEVLLVRASDGDPAPPDLSGAARDLGLVVTGTATLHEPLLVGLGLVASGQPLLLGADPAALSGLSSLTLYGRNLGWFAPLDAAAVAVRGPAAFAAALDQVAATANLTAGPLNLTWPSAVVLDAAARGQGSAERFAVLGAGAGALQLGFCLVLAAGRRPAARQHAGLLGRRGARPTQVLALETAQAVAAVGTGLVVGVLAGLGTVVLLLHGRVDRPAGAALAALATSWPTLLVLAAAAVLGSVVLTAAPAVRPGAVRAVLAAVGVLAGGVAVLALARPTADPTAPLPVVALVAVALGTGLVAGLLWSPLLALAARTGLPARPRRSGQAGRPGRGPSPLRQTVLLAARRPLLPGVTAGFLAAALATATLAGAWSASTQRSALDRAADLVPLDARVAPSTQVRLPADVVDPGRLRQLDPDVVVAPVTSTTVSAFAGSTGATALPLVGIDPDVLPLVHRWSAVTGSDQAPAEVAVRLRDGTANAPAGTAPVVPAGTRRLTFAVRGLDADVTLGAWVVGPDGQERQVRLGQHGDEASAGLDGGGALTVRSLEVDESADHSTHRQHGTGEGGTDRQLPSGTLHLGTVRADGVALPWSWAGWGADAATVRPEGTDASGLVVRYRIGDARSIVLPAWTPVAQRGPLPVVVDAVTAARAGARGTFGLTLGDTTQPVRVVAVLARMPTLPSRFVLADRAAVAALVDRTAPGTAPVAQVWVAAPGAGADAVRAALTSAASAATLTFRSDVAGTLATDPVTRGFVAVLATAGVVALLLALVAVVGGVRGDRDSSAADLFALEVDGVRPEALRRVLLARAGLVLAVGLPVGLLGGAALAAAAARLLATGPDGRPVTPPLQVVLVSAPTGLVLVVGVLGTVAVAAVAAAVSLREPRLAAPELDLR